MNWCLGSRIRLVDQLWQPKVQATYVCDHGPSRNEYDIAPVLVYDSAKPD
jgi:hypothetical protein